MAVIGDITDNESERLFDAIRPYRTAIQEKILSDCDKVESDDTNPGNLGILIQHTDKLTNGHYSGAAAHIMAGLFHFMTHRISGRKSNSMHWKRWRKNKSTNVNTDKLL